MCSSTALGALQCNNVPHSQKHDVRARIFELRAAIFSALLAELPRALALFVFVSLALFVSRQLRVQVGMLPVLTELTPCLKPHPTAWLTHNIRSSTPLYQHAAHYTHQHTLLCPGPLTAALLGVNSPWGTLWGCAPCCDTGMPLLSA